MRSRFLLLRSATGGGLWSIPRTGLLTNGVSCSAVAKALPAIVDGLEVADLDLRRHVESCLRCQAELAQYRKVLRALHQLRTELLEPAPPGLLPDVLAALEAAGERRAMRFLLTGRQAAYVGTIAAATAAGAAGAIVLASKARHRRVPVAS